MSGSGASRDSGDNENVNPRVGCGAVQLSANTPEANGEESTGSRILCQFGLDSKRAVAMDEGCSFSLPEEKGLSKSVENKECQQHENDPHCDSSVDPVDSSDMTRYISGDMSACDAPEVSLGSSSSGEDFVTVPAYSDSDVKGASGINGEVDNVQLQPDCMDDAEMGPSSPLRGRSDIELLYAASLENKSSENFPYPNDPEVLQDAGQACGSHTCLSCSQYEEGKCENNHSRDDSIREDIILDIEVDTSHPYIGGLTLDQLDDDVMYLIATFLEARAVRYGLSRVCQRFKAMFDNEAYWKMRITVRWPKRYPPVTCPPDFQWVDACVEREDNHRIWSDMENNSHHFMYGHNVYGEVDAVHLMKDGQFLVSGDRNRILNFIDLSKYSGPDSTEAQMKDMLVHTNRTVHQGWIWSITSLRNKVITGSWDTWIRMFDVDAGCQVVSSFKCKSAVLSLFADTNEVVASCFDKKVYFIDHRTSAVRSRIFHTKPVLCVTGNDNFIISGSEDKSISIYDRRAGKIFMMFKQLDSYPLCMSYKDNQLWFGDRSGRLHLHDGTEGVFQYVGTYDVGHTEKMTGLIYTRGAIYTCSGDRTIKVLHPTREPDTIATLAVHKKECANVDYENGVLVSAGGDDCIGVWLPKHWERDTYLL